jgi:hypothetical protein
MVLLFSHSDSNRAPHGNPSVAVRRVLFLRLTFSLLARILNSRQEEVPMSNEENIVPLFSGWFELQLSNYIRQNTDQFFPAFWDTLSEKIGPNGIKCILTKICHHSFFSDNANEDLYRTFLSDLMQVVEDYIGYFVLKEILESISCDVVFPKDHEDELAELEILPVPKSPPTTDSSIRRDNIVLHFPPKKMR